VRPFAAQFTLHCHWLSCFFESSGSEQRLVYQTPQSQQRALSARHVALDARHFCS
jgi:hypothetical protein